MPRPSDDLSAGRCAMQLILSASLCLALAAAIYFLVRGWRSFGGRQLLFSLPIQWWPDFQRWDQHSEFELQEAAALWFNAEPQLPMWWRARWKVRQLRGVFETGEVPGEPTALAGPPGIRGRISFSVTSHTRVHRDTLRSLAEKEGAAPLFLFPEFRFRSPQRDTETDHARLARIHQAVRFAVTNAESERNGLRARLEKARQSAGLLVGNMDNGDRAGAAPSELINIKERLRVGERRISQLKDHLAALRRIESAVAGELNS